MTQILAIFHREIDGSECDVMGKISLIFVCYAFLIGIHSLVCCPFLRIPKSLNLFHFVHKNFVSLIIFNKIHSLIESLLIVFDRFLTIFWQTKVAKNILFDCFDSFLYTHLFIYTCIWVPIMCLIWKREKKERLFFCKNVLFASDVARILWLSALKCKWWMKAIFF